MRASVAPDPWYTKVMFLSHSTASGTTVAAGALMVTAAAVLGALTSACTAPVIQVEAPAKIESIEKQSAPEFSALDQTGQKVALSDAPEGAITALIFYRGAW